jgi:hypothetical protein
LTVSRIEDHRVSVLAGEMICEIDPKSASSAWAEAETATIEAFASSKKASRILRPEA